MSGAVAGGNDVEMKEPEFVEVKRDEGDVEDLCQLQLNYRNEKLSARVASVTKSCRMVGLLQEQYKITIKFNLSFADLSKKRAKLRYDVS